MEDEYYLAHFEPESNFKEVIASLLYEDIEAMAEEHIYHRGFSYFKQGNVKEVAWSKKSLHAVVEGSAVEPYQVDIYLDEEGDLLGACDCPYDDTCKHIVAVLLDAEKSLLEVKDDNKTKSSEQFLQYLAGLNKEELVGLVDRFAPDTYRTEIAMRDASTEEAEKGIAKLQTLMFHTMQDRHMLYRPDDLFAKIEKYLGMLEVYLSKEPEMVFDAVCELVEKISDLSDEGFLFEDSYYDEYNYFDYDTLSKKIIGLINKVPDSEIQADIIVDCILTFEASDYFYFNYDLVKVQNKSLLIDACDDIESLSFYDFMQEVFDYDQKMEYLKKFPEEKVVIRKVDLFKAYGQTEEAVSYLKTLLLKKFTVEYAEYLMKLTKVSAEERAQFVMQAIESSAYTAYDFVMAHIGKCKEIDKIENLMQKLKPYWYYTYLSHHKRVDEMHDMLKRLPHEKAEFFSKYKKRYPEEAIAFYETVIKEELAYTGNGHYTTIANALSHLQVLIPKEVFDTKVNRLKAEYKRRRNFVEILGRRFNTEDKKLL